MLKGIGGEVVFRGGEFVFVEKEGMFVERDSDGGMGVGWGVMGDSGSVVCWLE